MLLLKDFALLLIKSKSSGSTNVGLKKDIVACPKV